MDEIVSSLHLPFLLRSLNNGSYQRTCLSRPHIVNFLPPGETEKGELNHAGAMSL